MGNNFSALPSIMRIFSRLKRTLEYAGIAADFAARPTKRRRVFGEEPTRCENQPEVQRSPDSSSNTSEVQHQSGACIPKEAVSSEREKSQARKRKFDDVEPDAEPAEQDWKKLCVHRDTLRGFTDLFPELLLLVFEYLDDDDNDLYTLTKVCHELGRTAIPWYLKKCGLHVIYEDSELLPARTWTRARLTTPKAFSVLPVWRRAHFLGRVDLLDLQFSKEWSKALVEKAKICEFIQSLPPPLRNSFAANIRVNWPSTVLHEADLRDLFKNVWSLGMKELTIDGTASGTGTLEIASYVQTAERRFAENITAFSSTTPVPFSPSVLSWTLGTLLYSPLQSLFLCQTGLSATQWAYLMPRVELPSLKFLTICDAISHPALLRFVQKHKSLVSLYYSTNTPATRPLLLDDEEKFSLPRLSYLTGPARFVDLLFEWLDSIPPLESLSFLPNTTRLGGRRRSTRTVRRLNPFAVQRTLELVVGCEELHALKFKLPIQLFGRPSIFDGIEPHAERSLNNVKSLELSCDNYFDEIEMRTILARSPTWIARFPAVQEVVILGTHVEERAEFLQSMVTHCPTVVVRFK